MADSDSRLWPGDPGGLATRNPRRRPSSRISAEGDRSEDALLPQNSAGDTGRQLGDSVPDAPPLLQRTPAENPTKATNRPLVSLKPKVITKSVALDRPDLDDLNFWPVILKWRAVTLLVLLYTLTGTAIGLLMWKSQQNPNHNFRLSSENVHMISRYFPSIVGTVTVLFFRQTVREALRMVPFVGMTDRRGEQSTGSRPWKGVGGAWFPWQSFTTTPKKFISIFSLACQFLASFIVSLKVALFASTPKIDNATGKQYWILTVRLYPAALLVLGYVVMIIYTLYVSFHFRWRSTGLKWDPVSIADYAALFAHCNALEYFAPLELRHDLRPKHVMLPDRRFRLGYWTRVRDNPRQTDIVYGVGVGFPLQTDTGEVSQKERDPLGQPWRHKLMFRKRKPAPNPVDKCYRPRKCAHGTWPNCEHYPYNYNPGCARWAIVLSSVLATGAFALSIYALVIRLPHHGFSLPNNLKFPGNFYYGHDASNHTLPPIDPADPKSTVLLWALIFRSAPTYVAGVFTSTIVTWIDLNMRFMQPFRNMFGKAPKKTFGQRVRSLLTWRPWASSLADYSAEPPDEDRTPATAAESILLAYITVSPLQVPLTAWDNNHFKVCIYSTLSTLSPLFPIFVGALVSVAAADETYQRVTFTFSMSAYIGLMVSLALYSVLIPAAMPGPYRLLPRQLYSLADLMALCHESKFMASPHLDITCSNRTPTKRHMESRLLLTDDRFLFGIYQGRDGLRHIGFDVAQEREPNFGPLKNLKNSVIHIPPEGYATRFQKTMTKIMEEGRSKGRAWTGAVTGHRYSPFSQRNFGLPAVGNYEMTVRTGQRSGTATPGSPQMSGGNGQPIGTVETPDSQVMSGGNGQQHGTAEASGSQARGTDNRGRARAAEARNAVGTL